MNKILLNAILLNEILLNEILLNEILALTLCLCINLYLIQKGDRTQLARKLNYSQGKKIIKEQQRLQQAPTSRRATRRQVQNKRRRKKYIENDRPTRTSVMKSDAWIDLTDIWFRENFDEGYGNTKTFVFKINGEEVVNRVLYCLLSCPVVMMSWCHILLENLLKTS